MVVGGLMCKNDLVQIGENSNIILLLPWLCERAFRNDVKMGNWGIMISGVKVRFLMIWSAI